MTYYLVLCIEWLLPIGEVDKIEHETTGQTKKKSNFLLPLFFSCQDRVGLDRTKHVSVFCLERFLKGKDTQHVFVFGLKRIRQMELTIVNNSFCISSQSLGISQSLWHLQHKSIQYASEKKSDIKSVVNIKLRI